MHQLVQCLINFAVALAASALLTLITRTFARKRGLVAKPRADRWHKKPTALFGGVGIYVAFVAAYLILRPAPLAGGNLLFLCATGMFLVGFVDDLVQLKPYAKLIGQIVFATLFTMFGLRLHWLPVAALDQAVTIFWLVGITNAINLLDNLDGLAGGIAAIASGYLVWFCHVGGQDVMAQLSAIFCGAVSGFLIFNFNPASIFMGDCGSLFLGFFLGGVSLVNNNQYGLRRDILAVLTIPVLLLLIPIVDTSLVTFSRKLNGRRVSQGGRDHASHRLVALGFSERAAALTLWAMAAASGAVAILVKELSIAVAALMVPVFILTIFFFLIFLGHVRVYEPVASPEEGRGRMLLPTLADFAYKRRLFEVLNDLTLIVLSYWAAYLLRFDGAIVSPYYDQFVNSLPFVIVIQLAAFLGFGLYRGLWRYTSMNDLTTLFKSAFGGWILSSAVFIFVYRNQFYSRGVLMMDAVLLFGGLAGSRISFRLLRSWISRFQGIKTGRRVLIYGAGDGGELLLRELQNNAELGLYPIGFVDDDPQKIGRVIHGVRVLGPSSALQQLMGAQKIDEVVVSTTKLGAEKSAALNTLCQAVGVNCRKMRIAFD